MRTSSPLQSSPVTRRRRARVRLLLACTGALLSVWLFFSLLGSGFSTLFTPVYALRVWWNESHNPVASYFRSHAALVRERETLEEKLRDATYDAARLAVLEAEHAQYASTTPQEFVTAQIVLFPTDTPYDTYLVNRGGLEGVVEQSLVYSGKTVVGKVIRVFPHSALVALFSTPGVHSPVYVYGPNIYAQAVGEGGGVMRIAVPQGIPLAVGDPVVVPYALTDIYGVIEHIQADPSDPDQYAYVTQKTALQSLRSFLIARTPPPTLTSEEAERIVSVFKEQASTTAPLADVLPFATTTADIEQ